MRILHSKLIFERINLILKIQQNPEAEMKVLLALFFFILFGGYESARTSQKYCGRRFSNVLAALCWDTDVNVMLRW